VETARKVRSSWRRPDRGFGRVGFYWKKKGPLRFVCAVLETALRPVFRVRRRCAFEALLDTYYPAPGWGANEKLVIVGPENRDTLDRELVKSLEIDRHREDWESIPAGNHLFVVADGTQYLHRGYVCTTDPPAVANHERKAIFFGRLRSAPTIRSCETFHHSMGKGLYRRALIAEFRYLQSLGYRTVVLYTMVENTASIRGVTAAGFRLTRQLRDWIVLNKLVFQRVTENGQHQWRVFCQ
jgi:hypothetical protein